MDPFYIFFNQYQTNSHEYTVIDLTNTYLVFGVVRVQPSYLFFRSWFASCYIQHHSSWFHLSTYHTFTLKHIISTHWIAQLCTYTCIIVFHSDHSYQYLNLVLSIQFTILYHFDRFYFLVVIVFPISFLFLLFGGVWFWRFLTKGLIWHFSQSYIRPLIYFSLILKSCSNLFLKQTCCKQRGQSFLIKDSFALWWSLNPRLTDYKPEPLPHLTEILMKYVQRNLNMMHRICDLYVRCIQ